MKATELKILGGKPTFKNWLPISRPTMPKFDKVAARLRKTFNSGLITTDKNVLELEERVAEYIGVRHVVALSSNSTGQMLSLRCWGLKGEVILPSFSFLMTSHVLAWNNLRPVFVDVEPETCNIDPKRVAEAITPRTSAIMGVHIWGNPCRADELQEIAKRHNIKFITDAAQAMGAQFKGRRVGGWADAEVFSCSPTKLLTCGEGGLVATDDDDLAGKLRRGRTYGMKPNYDCEIIGLNARMSEFHGAVGIESFAALEANMAVRRKRFALYKKLLSKLPGVTFPSATPGAEPNGIYFTIYIEEAGFGLDRNEVFDALLAENIMVKKYFDPPLHRLAVNQGIEHRPLPMTEKMVKRVMTLPLYSHSTVEMVETVCDTLTRVHKAADRVKAALAGR